MKLNVNGRDIPVDSPVLLSDVLQAHSDFKMPCAGRGHCGKCKVQAAGCLSAPDSVEQRLLTAAELQNGVRLACRTYLTGDATVRFSQGDETRVLLGDAGDGLTMPSGLGAAVDIGTTTLAVSLYDQTGLVCQGGCSNPQAAFGADVISRIQRSMDGDGALLATAIRQKIDQLLCDLCRRCGHPVTHLHTVVITGNTAMLYLLTGRDPTCLSRAPFEADWLAGEWLTGAQLQLSCSDAAVYLPPCISSFVGADITTAMLAVGLTEQAGTRLLTDIGTNGEMALWDGTRLVCCATAAGPAFEGAGLTMGMQGETGAISHVTVGDDGCLQATVIGGGEPKGICGSGVVDAVCCLLQTGGLDATGFLEEDPAPIAGGVVLTQEDVRQVQLAKSAICAGMETLLSKVGLADAGGLDELLIAGGFGAFLDAASARGIGLLPRQLPGKTTVCGNAALAGAARLLCREDSRPQAERIAAMAQPLNLATDPVFMSRYIDNMLFGEE